MFVFSWKYSVFHLPNLWKDEDLHAQFSNYGKVLSAKVMVEPDKKRTAFLIFDFV